MKFWVSLSYFICKFAKCTLYENIFGNNGINWLGWNFLEFSLRINLVITCKRDTLYCMYEIIFNINIYVYFVTGTRKMHITEFFFFITKYLFLLFSFFFYIYILYIIVVENWINFFCSNFLKLFIFIYIEMCIKV